MREVNVMKKRIILAGIPKKAGYSGRVKNLCRNTDSAMPG